MHEIWIPSARPVDLDLRWSIGLAVQVWPRTPVQHHGGSLKGYSFRNECSFRSQTGTHRQNGDCRQSGKSGKFGALELASEGPDRPENAKRRTMVITVDCAQDLVDRRRYFLPGATGKQAERCQVILP